MSNFHGPTLVDVLGGIGSLVALTRVPAVLAAEGNLAISRRAEKHAANRIAAQIGHDRLRERCAQVAYAWMPWVLLSVMVFLWGWPAWKTMLNGGTDEQPNCLAGISKISFEVPWLHKRDLSHRPGGRSAAEAPTARRKPEDGRLRSSTGSRPPARASSWRRCSRRSGCGSRRRVFLRRVRRDAVPRPLGAVDHRLHVGPGVHDEVQRGRRHAGAGLHPHRLALSVLRPAAGLAGRGADRLRHLVQRPVRQPAADHRRTVGPESRC